VLTDERPLAVVSDVLEATRRYEGYDVESGDVVFYDERGRRLTPTFPYRSETRILGLRVTEDSGPYELTVEREGHPDVLSELDTVAYLEENPWFECLDEIRAALAGAEDAP